MVSNSVDVKIVEVVITIKLKNVVLTLAVNVMENNAVNLLINLDLIGNPFVSAFLRLVLLDHPVLNANGMAGNVLIKPINVTLKRNNAVNIIHMESIRNKKILFQLMIHLIITYQFINLTEYVCVEKKFIHVNHADSTKLKLNVNPLMVNVHAVRLWIL